MFSIKYAQNMLPNFIAFAFVMSGYPCGVYLLFSENWLLNLMGVLLTSEALIISAYLIHEFAHWSIFKKPATNQSWAELMSWINGSCYSTYQDIRDKHMRHHVDRADILSFNVTQMIRKMPAAARNTIIVLEWLYIPAVEILMHLLVTVLPFTVPELHHKRARLAGILLVRVPLFALMAWISPKAWLLYLLCYCIMITALRFADAFQHTYEVFLKQDLLESGGKISDGTLRDRAYEQANTFSNLVSVRHPWLNLLFLNFPYHNAHHEKPIVPWFQLPQLHRKLLGDTSELPVIPMTRLLKAFHQHRVKRLLSDDYGRISHGEHGADGFIGGLGVSFLTAM